MKITCPKCGGSGRQPRSAEEAKRSPFLAAVPELCDPCGGSGKIEQTRSQMAALADKPSE